jgi:hypothetical protein
MLVLTICTDGTLPIERTEPKTAQDKHDQYEQWYARVNSECDCGRAEKCGDKYRSVLQKTVAEGVTSNARLRRLHVVLIANVRLYWRTDSKHYSKQSATCDHEHMPRELLPRLGSTHTVTSDKWPYLSQSAMDDVRAMRYIRGSHATTPYSTMWQTLQPRLQQYAFTGAGSVAETIVTNDYWWTGQVAHEEPSGSKSQALKRRNSIV